jgi:hypothetical protein
VNLVMLFRCKAKPSCQICSESVAEFNKVNFLVFFLGLFYDAIIHIVAKVGIGCTALCKIACQLVVVALINGVRQCL